MTRNRFGYFFLLLIAGINLVSSSLFAADDAKDFNKKGLNEMRLGNFKEAADLLQKAMKLQPNWAEPYYNYYQLMRQVKKIQDSRKFLKKAFDLEPDNTTYKEEITRVLKDDLLSLKQSGDKEKLKSTKNLLLQINPGEVEVALEVVMEHFEAKEFDKAKSMINKLLEENKSELPKYRNGAIGDLYYILARIENEDKEIKAALEHSDKATRYPLEHATEAKELNTALRKTVSDMVNAYIASGKNYVAKGDYSKAMDEFNKALVFDPGNEIIESQIELMDNQKQVGKLIADSEKLVAQEKWLEARDILEFVIKVQPKNSEAKKNLQKAVNFEEQLMKKLGKAEKLPRSSGERASMAQAFIGMGKRYMDVKNYKEAKISFDRALVLVDLDTKLEKLREEINSEIGKITTVDTTKQAWDKGVEHYKLKEYEECLKTMLSLPPGYSEDLFSFLSYCYWKTNDLEKAKEFAHRQLEKQPDNNRAKYVLANIFSEGGDNSSANKLALEIKASDPDYPLIDDLVYKTGAMRWGPLVIPVLVIAVLLYIAYVIYSNLPEYYKKAGINRAKSFLKAGNYKEAIEELNKVKKMPNVDAYDGAVISRILAPCFLKNASYDKAIGECKHLLSINPSDAETHQWLGFAYLGRRMVTPESLTELLTLYKSEKDKKNVALLQLLGSHYTSQKTLSAEGVEVLEKWYELEPTNPDVLKSLGKHYLQKGKTDATAMKVFESMMTTSKPEPDFMLGIAKLHLKLNQHESCLKICETVLTMDVNNEIVHPILRECYKKMDKIPELVEIYRTFLAENPYNVAFQKGLTEAMKIVGKAGPAAKEVSSVDGPPVVQVKENETLCPHCNKVSLNTDYYCQHCGQSLAQG